VLGGNQGDAVSVTTMAKADLLGLRWPLTPPKAPKETSTDTSFDRALRHVLAMEGGWTDDPHDPGGPTNFGITLVTYAAHKDIKLSVDTVANLKADLRTISSSMVRTIYRDRYWRPCLAQLLPAPLALMHFDAAVNHGVGGAARLLQRALSVDVDGDIGPLTLAAAHQQTTNDVLVRYAAERRARYRSLSHFWRFGRGWLARVDATLAASQAVALEPFAGLTSTPTAPGVQPMPTPVIVTETTKRPQTNQPSPSQPTKWWAHSVTVWGTLITALATVLPLLGPALGIDIKPELVRQLGDNLTVTAQAVAGLAGTIMALYGRSVATTRLERRDVTIPV
jgi:lysozyme family protein